MNEDLLKRIAACAPKEMGAVFMGGSPGYLLFWKSHVGIAAADCLMSTESDIYNGSPIVAMLDAMEKKRHRPAVWMDVSGGYVCNLLDIDETMYEGETRAEAVGLAFCQVFEKDKP